MLARHSKLRRMEKIQETNHMRPRKALKRRTQHTGQFLSFQISALPFFLLLPLIKILSELEQHVRIRLIANCQSLWIWNYM